MKKVDLVNNYIRNDVSITEEFYKEMVRVTALVTQLEHERKQLMINKIVDTIVWLLIGLLIVITIAYVFIPGGYGW